MILHKIYTLIVVLLISQCQTHFQFNSPNATTPGSEKLMFVQANSPNRSPKYLKKIFLRSFVLNVRHTRTYKIVISQKAFN